MTPPVRRSGIQAAIVLHQPADVKQSKSEFSQKAIPVGKKRRKRTRRQAHGSAWHWQQTDSWYYTLPGTKKRIPLFDEDGSRIRGIENKKAAQLALGTV
jgi:hypothetical protein